MMAADTIRVLDKKSPYQALPAECITFQKRHYVLYINNELGNPQFTWLVADLAVKGWLAWMDDKAFFRMGPMQIVLDDKVVGTFFMRQLERGLGTYTVS